MQLFDYSFLVTDAALLRRLVSDRTSLLLIFHDVDSHKAAVIG